MKEISEEMLEENLENAYSKLAVLEVGSEEYERASKSINNLEDIKTRKGDLKEKKKSTIGTWAIRGLELFLGLVVIVGTTALETEGFGQSYSALRDGTRSYRDKVFKK